MKNDGGFIPFLIGSVFKNIHTHEVFEIIRVYKTSYTPEYFLKEFIHLRPQLLPGEMRVGFGDTFDKERYTLVSHERLLEEYSSVSSAAE